jgi:hypothetical protein
LKVPWHSLYFVLEVAAILVNSALSERDLRRVCVGSNEARNKDESCMFQLPLTADILLFENALTKAAETTHAMSLVKIPPIRTNLDLQTKLFGVEGNFSSPILVDLVTSSI